MVSHNVYLYCNLRLKINFNETFGAFWFIKRFYIRVTRMVQISFSSGWYIDNIGEQRRISVL